MTINYPTSLDTFTNPTGTDLLENAVEALDHDVQHSNANDAIEALEAKVGINGSAVNTSFDFKLSTVATGDKAVSLTGTETLTNKTLTAPQINFGSDANGDLIYRNGSGVTARLAIGSTDQILAVQAGVPAWIANPAASNASTTVKGVVEEATQSEVDAGTSTGDTGARLYVNPSTIVNLIEVYYGDGSDGDVTISTNTTLSRDMYYDNLTINSTFTLSTGGYRIFVKGTLTNNGTIANNGLNGSNGGNATGAAIGTGGAGGAAPAGVTVFSTANAGTTGGNGSQQGGGAPTVGGNGTNITYSVGTIGGKGGNGGNGGTGNAGAVSGTVGTVTASGTNGIKDLILAFTQSIAGNPLKAGTPGTGGGGGLADGSPSGTHYSGGAGGGGGVGGVVFVAAKTLAGTGVLSAIGGNGGNGGTGNIGSATGNAGAGGAGGGGGGAGGILLLVSTTTSNPYTMTVTGGTGGTGSAAVNIGSANASDGSNGANGTAGVSYFLSI